MLMLRIHFPERTLIVSVGNDTVSNRKNISLGSTWGLNRHAGSCTYPPHPSSTPETAQSVFQKDFMEPTHKCLETKGF